MPRLSRLPALLTVLLAVALGGCSMKNQPQTEPESGELAEARVNVMNNNWLDMVVYAERGGMRIRLGTVTSMTREMLTIPQNVLVSSSGIRLIASPIGSSANYATYPFDVWPGDTVEFKIENNLGTSNVSTW
ncbi:MAG TPA: hypothetical protein VMN39_03115 [Longimicrobiaceae bacterium]|nr:hypothetical protein [Longimicrobiaceae bacterium]